VGADGASFDQGIEIFFSSIIETFDLHFQLLRGIVSGLIHNVLDVHLEELVSNLNSALGIASHTDDGVHKSQSCCAQCLVLRVQMLHDLRESQSSPQLGQNTARTTEITVSTNEQREFERRTNPGNSRTHGPQQSRSTILQA
jgi:hypothetical protein